MPQISNLPKSHEKVPKLRNIFKALSIKVNYTLGKVYLYHLEVENIKNNRNYTLFWLSPVAISL